MIQTIPSQNAAHAPVVTIRKARTDGRALARIFQSGFSSIVHATKFAVAKTGHKNMILLKAMETYLILERFIAKNLSPQTRESLSV
jgi:hypothetical protein